MWQRGLQLDPHPPPRDEDICSNLDFYDTSLIFNPCVGVRAKFPNKGLGVFL
jgi:hypothetical protein